MYYFPGKHKFYCIDFTAQNTGKDIRKSFGNFLFKIVLCQPGCESGSE